MSEQSAIHIVSAGETLSSIAKKHYGDAGKYMAIFNANKDQLSNPDKIQVGQKLIIPKIAGAAGQ